MKAFLAGEGPSEIGRWSVDPRQRDQSPRGDGVLGALFSRLHPQAEIVNGRTWRFGRMYRAGEHRTAEQRRVLGLLLDAKEAGATLLVFSRDSDRKPEREHEIDGALSNAAQLIPGVSAAGGVANPCVEAWMVAMQGERDCEARSVEALKQFGLSTSEMEELARSADLPTAERCSASLSKWLARVRAAK